MRIERERGDCLFFFPVSLFLLFPADTADLGFFGAREYGEEVYRRRQWLLLFFNLTLIVSLLLLSKSLQGNIPIAGYFELQALLFSGQWSHSLLTSHNFSPYSACHGT
jgi:hypothetical protein